MVANYAYVRSRETTEEGRVEVPLTPRHTVGLDGAWEFGDVGGSVLSGTTLDRTLEANPYRRRVRYSVFGVLASRRMGRALAVH